MIHDQVKLPLRTALRIVKQGIRIRFGRSLVTIAGIACGTAFIMSVLTGSLLREGVSTEDSLRSETNRMQRFLEVEAGPPADRTYGIIVAGPLSNLETRFVEALAAEGLRRINLVNPQRHPFPFATGSSNPADSGKQDVLAATASPRTVGQNTSAIVVVGDGSLPPGAGGDSYNTLFADARQRVLAATRNYAGLPDKNSPETAAAPDSGENQETLAAVANGSPEDETLAAGAQPLALTPRIVYLDREYSEEELAALALRERRERARAIWILVISTLVTVMGIANAMLMSVTERFREIGTMKCLGALSGFVRVMFLIESAIFGAAGGAVGCLGGMVFAIAAYAVTYSPGLIASALIAEWGRMLGALGIVFAAGILLSIFAALYPAQVASRMVPANALRTNI